MNLSTLFNSTTNLLLFGGLDTVASMMGFIARFLATHPQHRRDLLEHPELRRNAVEELIRRRGQELWPGEGPQAPTPAGAIGAII